MNYEQATFFIGLAVLCIQGFNAYVTLGLKFWVTKNFVSKDDMTTYLSPLKDAVQMLYSQGRLSKER